MLLESELRQETLQRPIKLLPMLASLLEPLLQQLDQEREVIIEATLVGQIHPTP